MYTQISKEKTIVIPKLFESILEILFPAQQYEYFGSGYIKVNEECKNIDKDIFLENLEVIKKNTYKGKIFGKIPSYTPSGVLFKVKTHLDLPNYSWNNYAHCKDVIDKNYILSNSASKAYKLNVALGRVLNLINDNLFVSRKDLDLITNKGIYNNLNKGNQKTDLINHVMVDIDSVTRKIKEELDFYFDENNNLITSKKDVINNINTIKWLDAFVCCLYKDDPKVKNILLKKLNKYPISSQISYGKELYKKVNNANSYKDPTKAKNIYQEIKSRLIENVKINKK